MLVKFFFFFFFLVIDDRNWWADQRFLSVQIGEYLKNQIGILELKAYEGYRLDWIYAPGEGWEGLLTKFFKDLTDAHCFKETYVDNIDLIKMFFKYLFDPDYYELFEEYITGFLEIRNKLKPVSLTGEQNEIKPVLKTLLLKNH